MSMEDIIVAVINEKLFGMVVCDISVPDRWPAHLSHPTMTHYEYFSEMTASPIDRGNAGSSIINRDSITKVVHNTWFGRYQNKPDLEYDGQKCFKSFLCDVTDARHQGDVDPSKAILDWRRFSEIAEPACFGDRVSWLSARLATETRGTL